MAVRGGTAGGGRDEVERLAEEFLERRRRGEPLAIEEYLERRPDLAAEIREVFPTLLLVEELGPEMASAGGATAPPSAAAPAEPGGGLRQVGEYRILREVGRGGMGIVYEAVQETLGRRVALKVLPLHSLLEPKHLERFRQEARAAARLSHPNIVPVFGVGEHLGLHYYVMQFIPGQGLDHVIEEIRRLRAEGKEAIPPPSGDSPADAREPGSGSGRVGRDRYHRNAARIARDAALALDHAHREGILHRDVKPSNLLVDPTGHVWLADFGLAKSEGGDDLTKSGDFVGTFRYMAPERFNGWSDPRSDVYALGLTLYELLSLRPAFIEKDRARLLRKVAAEEPPALRRLDRAIPRDLETLVLKATAKEPAQRYESARAMADDLERYLRGEPVEARRSGALGRLGRWCARNRTIAALLAAVLLLLAAVAAVSLTAVDQLAAERDLGQEKLRDAYLAQARARRASGRPGRRFEALVALRRAGEIHPGPDLQDEAIACLSLADLRRVRSWEMAREDRAYPDDPFERVALVKLGGEIVVRATEDDREVLRLPGPGFAAEYTFIRFSPDGRQLAARYHRGSKDQWALWDLDRGVAAARVPDAGATDSVGFSPDGSWVALGVKDGSLRVLDPRSGEVLGQVSGKFRASSLAVHPGGKLLAVSDQSAGSVLVLDRGGGEVLRLLREPGPEPFTGVAWHPDGRLLAAARFDRKVYVWDAEAGELRWALEGHEAETQYVAFGSRGDLLLSAGWDTMLRFWDLGSGRFLFAIPGQLGDLSRDDRSFWGFFPGGLESWEVAPARAAFTLFGHGASGHGGRAAKHPHSISLASGLGLAASSGDDGVRLWDLSARRELAHLPLRHTATVRFDASGENLYTGGESGVLRWPVRLLRPSGAPARSLALGPPEFLSQIEGVKRLALGDGDRRIAFLHFTWHAHLISIDDSRRHDTLQGLPGMETIALSPDGRWAAAGAPASNEVQVWDLPEGMPSRRLPAQRANVMFDPAGAFLVTAAPQEYVFWRTSDWSPARRIARARGLTFPGPIAFDRAGRAAAITITDSRIWILEPASGDRLAEIESWEELLVNGLALDLDGGYLAASTRSRRLHVWDLRELAAELRTLGLEWPIPAGVPRSGGPLRLEVLGGGVDQRHDRRESPRSSDLFRRHRSALFLPELRLPDEIDLALEVPRLLVSEGTEWKFARGRQEPSPGLEWTGVEFNDQSWEEGTGGFTGSRFPGADEETALEEQPKAYTSLYLRRPFQAEPMEGIERLLLAVRFEQGYVAYLNGVEVGRANAGPPGARVGHNGLADRFEVGRVVDRRAVDASLLRKGKNVLAVQAITAFPRNLLAVLPVLAAELRADPARERSRTGNLSRGADGAPDPFLLSYRDARILERAGRHREALAEFERASSLDASRPEPVLRRIACLGALGELERAESLARESIEEGVPLEDGRLRQAWSAVVLSGLRLSPAAALERLPRHPPCGSRTGEEDYGWLLGELAEGGALRIDCGGPDRVAADGRRWGRDRFHLAGAAREAQGDGGAPLPIEGTEDGELYRRERWFPGEDAFRPGYRIPLPPARYRVSLHFAEVVLRKPRSGVFDVLLEDRIVLEDYEPLRAGFARPETRSFELEVSDGFLDLDFVAHRDSPKVSAIEIERLGG